MTDIAKLREIIDDIDVLISHNVMRSDSEFKQWHNKAKRFLHNHYGEDSFEYKSFVNLKFTLSAYFSDTPNSEFIKECRNDLIVSKGIFCDYLSDLEDEAGISHKSCEISNDSILVSPQ